MRRARARQAISRVGVVTICAISAMAIVASVAPVARAQVMRPSLLANIRRVDETPRDARDPWFGRDKAKHFVASAAIQSLAYAVFRRHETPRHRALWQATAVTAVIGLGKEVWDARGHGDASWRDLAWDGIGMAAGSGLVLAIDRGPSAPSTRSTPK